MTILTLIRHGQTDWNRDQRIQGTTDIPLNDVGRSQARDAAATLHAHLDPQHPVVVVASDLMRARETAQIIAGELDLEPPRLYAALRERAYGEAEGLQTAEFFRRWGDWHTADVPGAETRAALRTRALGALRAVVRDVRRETAPAPASVVVVSHGAFIREVIGHATGGELPLAGERVVNGSGYRMLVERDRVRLLSYGPIAA